MPVRVLIADDHPPIIEGLTTAFGRHDIEVVGLATSTSDVLKTYEVCQPDVAVLDVMFGEPTTGLDVAKQLIAAWPEARIVIYSQFDQDAIIHEAYRLGGVGFVTKNLPSEVLADVIKQVHTGKIHFLPHIAERLALIGIRSDEAGVNPHAMLDSREYDVFKAMALGHTNNEIAETLGVSVKTAWGIAHSVKEKLKVQRAADITLLAVKFKVIEP